MIFSIKLCLMHNGRINGKKNIEFNPGLNVVVGPNGSGKSSLLKAVYHCPDCLRENDGAMECHYFNSEIMNPHRSEDNFKGPTGSIIKIRAMFSSHGETMRDVLRFIPLKKNGCLLLDEPESGHDLKWIIKIRKGLDALAAADFQIIVATHHPIFWKNANVIELKRGYVEKSLNKFKKNL
ncbi:MAG: AAA family ATPase [Candidatus Omnitrophica bacterium]|nr:AAA family ATPase [Candidatus Omnitrophota bacterium]